MISTFLFIITSWTATSITYQRKYSKKWPFILNIYRRSRKRFLLTWNRTSQAQWTLIKSRGNPESRKCLPLESEVQCFGIRNPELGIRNPTYGILHFLSNKTWLHSISKFDALKFPKKWLRLLILTWTDYPSKFVQLAVNTTPFKKNKTPSVHWNSEKAINFCVNATYNFFSKLQYLPCQCTIPPR